MTDSELTAIGAVLSSYIYGDLIPSENHTVSIGTAPNEFFFLRNLSKHDVHMFATTLSAEEARKVFVVFKGTTDYKLALETWPIIASGTENVKRNYWSEYFNERLDYVTEKLAALNETKETLELHFAGHSLGGSMAKVAANHFYDNAYQTKGYAFNPGNGLLANQLVFKLAKDFLKKHSNNLIGFYTPEYAHEGLKTLKDKVVDELLGNWMNSTKFHPKHTRQHVTIGDPASLLGLDKDTTFYKNEQGDYWNFFSNHDMENLKKQVLDDINLHEIVLKHHHEGAAQRAPVPDVLMFRLNRSVLKIPEELQNYKLDPLQLNDIDNFQPLVALSRINFLNDLNKFNI